MEILEGRELDAAVLKTFGPIESSADAYLHDRPCYEDGLLKYHKSADLTWAVVDGLRAKGWVVELKQPLRLLRDTCYCSLQRGGTAWGAEHAHRNTAVLNACLGV